MYLKPILPYTFLLLASPFLAPDPLLGTEKAEKKAFVRVVYGNRKPKRDGWHQKKIKVTGKKVILLKEVLAAAWQEFLKERKPGKLTEEEVFTFFGYTYELIKRRREEDPSTWHPCYLVGNVLWFGKNTSDYSMHSNNIPVKEPIKSFSFNSAKNTYVFSYYTHPRGHKERKREKKEVAPLDFRVPILIVSEDTAKELESDVKLDLSALIKEYNRQSANLSAPPSNTSSNFILGGVSAAVGAIASRFFPAKETQDKKKEEQKVTEKSGT